MKKVLLFTLICISIVCPKTGFSQQDIYNLDSLMHIDPQKQAKIDAAFALADQVEQAGAFIESLADLFTNQVITLPVGIKNGEYSLIIQKLTYDNTTTRFTIYATCAFTFKENGQQIAFEGSVELEGQQGLGTHGALQLIAPVKRDLGEQATVVFLDGTKVNFGCDGVESFDAKIGLMVTSNKIIAVDNQGNPTGKPISTLFETSFADFNRFTASFSFNNSFKFSGLDDVIFTLKGATIDQNDESTPASIKFPDNYFGTANSEEKNVWKGISISEASVALPKIFKKPQADGNGSTNDRIVLSMNNVLIDNNGFSAFVAGNNIINSGSIQKDQWDITLEDLSLNMVKNQVIGFGFGGELNIPPFGKNSLVPYTAIFNSSTNEFEFVAGLKGQYEFPVFRSKLDLLETSTISILVRDEAIYPTLNLTGKISIDAPVSQEDSTKRFGVPDINFEQLKLSREDPYVEIGFIGVSGDLTSPKVAGFQLSIGNIHSISDNVGSGLGFDAGIKISDMFIGEAGLKLYGDYKRFKFDKLAIDKAQVGFKANSFEINGMVMFKNGDATYGTGFRGELTLKVMEKFDLQAIGVFGKVNDYRYFLTDAFLELQPASGIKVSFLNFYGFGGGLYTHMQQSTLPEASEFGKSLSGICYVPDKKVGLGLMAATKFGLSGASSAFNAKVSFEMQFNDSWGLNFAQLRGEGAFMYASEKMASLNATVQSKVKALEQNSGVLKQASKADLKVPDMAAQSTLSGDFNIKYDVANKTFTADMAAYLQSPFMKGVGENSRMGWASAYFSDSKWYTYIGTPTDPLGIEILNLARTTSYFMVGNDIPALPSPPEKVLKNLSADMQEKLKRGMSSVISEGSGLAFGQALELNFNATLPPFYAKMGIGLGGEFLLKNYGAQAFCAGHEGTLGIDGWYASGQVWAYAEADIGMEAKIFKRSKKFSILDISTGALLTGAGPNPFYFTGSVGGNYNIMGGMITGHCDFDFEIGEQCIIAGGSPFGENVIASMTPGDQENDVNVFGAPQLVLNIPSNIEMKIEEAEGLYGYYKISIDKFEVKYKESGQVITGLYELSSDGKVYLLDPEEPFESHKKIEMYAKVGFKRKVNNSWQNVTGSDGSAIYEELTYTFTSGERPDYIMAEHVKYSYPIDRQFNYYPNEYKQGYFMVTENYSYLFTTDKPVGFTQVIRASHGGQTLAEVPFTYTTNAAGSAIRMEINFNMTDMAYANNTIYNLALINKPIAANAAANSNVTANAANVNQGNNSITVTTQQTEGNIERLDVKEIYGIDFRVSKYNNFADRINQTNPEEVGYTWPVDYKVDNILSAATKDEIFDKFEHDRTFKLIDFEADLNNTPWFRQSLYYDMYQLINENDLSRDSEIKQLGYPPKNGILIENSNTTKTLTDEEINLGYSNYNYTDGVFTYQIPFWIAKDYFAARNYVAIKVAKNYTLNNTEKAIIESMNLQVVTKGNYPIKLKYKLPGKEICTSDMIKNVVVKNN